MARYAHVHTGEPSGAAQPHLVAADIADAPRFGRGAGPQARRGRTAEVNGLSRLRVGASRASRRRGQSLRRGEGSTEVSEGGV